MRKRIIIELLLFLCFLITACHSREDFTYGINAKYREKIIAHRGLWNGDISRQNSLIAIKDAISFGIWGSEIDIHQTIDSFIVLNHDYFFYNLEIETHSLSELKLTDGSTLPLLNDALNIIKNSNTHILIEVKNANVSLIKNVLGETLVSKSQIAYMSFSKECCDRMINMEFSPVYLLLERLINEEEIKELHKCGYSGVAFEYNVLKNAMHLISICHSYNMKSLAWTVNNVQDIKLFLQAGADYVITDILSDICFTES